MTAPDVFPWQRDFEFPNARRAERAVVGRFELIAYDVPASDGLPDAIGWEIFTGPDFGVLLAKGGTATFEQAKEAAQAAYAAHREPRTE